MAMASSSPSHWAPGWGRRCSPTDIFAPVWNWATIRGARARPTRIFWAVAVWTSTAKKEWNKLLQEAIAQTLATFNWDHLYIGGGNTKKIDFTPGPNVQIVSNETGLLGGVALWREA